MSNYAAALNSAISRLNNVKSVNIPLYSPFQVFVLNYISEVFFCDLFPDEIFFFSEWSNEEELLKVWFGWIDRNVSWYHDLPPEMRGLVDKHSKQDKFRFALNWCYKFKEMYEKTGVIEL